MRDLALEEVVPRTTLKKGTTLWKKILPNDNRSLGNVHVLDRFGRDEQIGNTSCKVAKGFLL